MQALLDILKYIFCTLFSEHKRDISSEIAQEARDNIHTRSGM